MSKFNGSSGKKPSAEARRYVYACLAATLECDLTSGADYLYGTGESDDLNEFDVRRVKAAALKVIKELKRKAAR